MKARKELNRQLYEQKMDGDTRAQLRDEYALYEPVLCGNPEAAAQRIENGTLLLHRSKRLLSENTLRNLCYHFVIEASTLARLCMENGLSHDEAYTLCDIYIGKLDQAAACENVELLYRQMCLDFAERMAEIRKSAAASRHVRKCMDYIYENLGGDLSLRTLSRVTGLNPSYLSRLFAREAGCPVRQFILAAKVDTARNLLQYSELSCSRIASSLGFSSQSAFISVFSKFVRMTPGAYRAQYALAASAPEHDPSP